MKITFMNGGLANQSFQYIFYRFGQLRRPNEDWFVDDSFFYIYTGVHNGYELERVFGVRPNLLSRYFDADVWEHMLDVRRRDNVGIAQILSDSGVKLDFVAEVANSVDFNPYHGEQLMMKKIGMFLPQIADMEGNVYYHGYWIIQDWFRAYEEIFRDELKFPPLDGKNLETAAMISSENALAVHVRRGDFVTQGRSSSADSYKSAMLRTCEKFSDIKLFVFSDDIAYCRQNKSDLGFDLVSDVTYVSWNTGDMAFCDMHLMSLCPNMILCSSSFCFLAAMLNRNVRYIDNA